MAYIFNISYVDFSETFYKLKVNSHEGLASSKLTWVHVLTPGWWVWPLLQVVEARAQGRGSETRHWTVEKGTSSLPSSWEG